MAPILRPRKPAKKPDVKKEKKGNTASRRAAAPPASPDNESKLIVQKLSLEIKKMRNEKLLILYREDKKIRAEEFRLRRKLRVMERKNKKRFRQVVLKWLAKWEKEKKGKK